MAEATSNPVMRIAPLINNGPASAISAFTNSRSPQARAATLRTAANSRKDFIVPPPHVNRPSLSNTGGGDRPRRPNTLPTPQQSLQSQPERQPHQGDNNAGGDDECGQGRLSRELLRGRLRERIP